MSVFFFFLPLYGLCKRIRQCQRGIGCHVCHLEYIWTTERNGLKTMAVGDIVQYKGITYYIKEAEILVQNASVRHQYRFCMENGFCVKEMHNPYMTGLSLPGSVEKVSGDQVQVKLDIDAVEKHNCWYTYSTFYSTFYCMPEIGDRVLY